MGDARSGGRGRAVSLLYRGDGRRLVLRPCMADGRLAARVAGTRSAGVWRSDGQDDVNACLLARLDSRSSRGRWWERLVGRVRVEE
jgi:hypothetical protein